MPRLIDANALIAFMRKGWRVFPSSELRHTCDITDIENVPTIDAIEVVRCKDCKYYNLQHHYCEGIGNWFGIEGEWGDNGYCYKGERREDETN